MAQKKNSSKLNEIQKGLDKQEGFSKRAVLRFSQYSTHSLYPVPYTACVSYNDPCFRSGDVKSEKSLSPPNIVSLSNPQQRLNIRLFCSIILRMPL